MAPGRAILWKMTLPSRSMPIVDLRGVSGAGKGILGGIPIAFLGR
jgi:hypothetical protein